MSIEYWISLYFIVGWIAIVIAASIDPRMHSDDNFIIAFVACLFWPALLVILATWLGTQLRKLLR